MIPNSIFTVWLNDKPPPERIKECISSQKRKLLTLENIPTSSSYLTHCINSGSWVKAADYVRIDYLNRCGGIFLDADCELLGSLDKFRDNGMFVFKEDSEYLWNGCIGAEAGHPFLKYYLNTVERNFRYDTNTFDSGMQFFTESYYIADRKTLRMEIYEWEQTNKILNHLGMKSWL